MISLKHSNVYVLLLTLASECLVGTPLLLIANIVLKAAGLLSGSDQSVRSVAPYVGNFVLPSFPPQKSKTKVVHIVHATFISPDHKSRLDHTNPFLEDVVPWKRGGSTTSPSSDDAHGFGP